MRLAIPFLTGALILALAGCAATGPGLPTTGADVLLIGEQHDAASHPKQQQAWVEGLAQRGRLAVLALEMADRGRSTAGLPRTATDAQVREALRWNVDGWPWERYGLPVMAAVRAGVLVVGANLPRDELRLQMQNTAIDRVLPPAGWETQREAIRKGHCNLLAPAQIDPLTRVQIGRDLAMAETITKFLAPSGTVVLLAGAGHVHPTLGIPVHLPRWVQVRTEVLAPEDTGRDYCAELRKQLPTNVQ